MEEEFYLVQNLANASAWEHMPLDMLKGQHEYMYIEALNKPL